VDGRSVSQESEDVRAISAPRVSGAYIADCAHRTSSAARAPLRAGEDPPRARRATRLLQAYQLEFWDALAAVAER
jgi:hypothetical protein